MNKEYTIQEIERACRLFLQDTWNDQSEIRAESPERKEIIWGGLIGEEITKHWEKIKGFLTPLTPIKYGKITTNKRRFGI